MARIPLPPESLPPLVEAVAPPEDPGEILDGIEEGILEATACAVRGPLQGESKPRNTRVTPRKYKAADVGRITRYALCESSAEEILCEVMRSLNMDDEIETAVVAYLSAREAIQAALLVVGEEEEEPPELGAGFFAAMGVLLTYLVGAIILLWSYIEDIWESIPKWIRRLIEWTGKRLLYATLFSTLIGRLLRITEAIQAMARAVDLMLPIIIMLSCGKVTRDKLK